MKLEISHNTDIDKYMIENHYLHSAPAGARLRLWIKADNSTIIGAMMWGRPTARTYDYNRIMELTRLHLTTDTEHCAESKAISMARKLIRKDFSQIKGLISYCSTGEGHKGIVYLADGWFVVGTTRGTKWNKEGRKNIDASPKIRWVRSV